MRRLRNVFPNANFVYVDFYDKDRLAEEVKDADAAILMGDVDPVLLGENTLNVMQDILFEICGLPQVAPGMHESVELVLRKKENKTVVSLINASGYFGNSFFAPVPMTNIELHIPVALQRHML